MELWALPSEEAVVADPCEVTDQPAEILFLGHRAANQEIQKPRNIAKPKTAPYVVDTENRHQHQNRWNGLQVWGSYADASW
jgi:hypothetical protein